MNDEIVAKVIDIIARTQYIPRESISPESSFEELGIDSLGGLAIIAEVEKEFGLTVPNEMALGLRDVQQVIESIRSLAAADAAAPDGV
jgi:acyl carrier protein